MRTVTLLLGVMLLLALARPGSVTAQPPRALALADLVALAEERSPAIAAARQAVEAAEARVALARAGRGPTVTASGSVGTTGSTSPAATTGFTSSVSLTSSYVLYDSGQIQHAIRQAEAGLRAARLALEVVRQDVAHGVAQAYVSVLRAERTVTQREQTVRLNHELVRLADGQFRAGVVPRADVVRAQAGLAAAEGDLIAARNAVEQAKAALNVAVGLPPLTPMAVAPPAPVPPLTVSAADLVRLVDERPEVKRALAEIEAAEAALALAQAGNGVRILLTGSATQALAPGTTTSYAITSTVSLPVTDAGRGQAQVAEATANLAAARARIETTRLTVHQQAVNAFLAIQDARARIASARAQLAFAQESVRLAQGRFAAGAGPLLEVTDAQTALVLAEVTLTRAEYDELAGIISLRYALGRSVVTGQI